MYDAIIIGARVAGSPTAMILAQKGYKVLLLDRDSFPSDTISTHILLPKGFSLMKKWGLASKILSSNCPVIHNVTFDVGPFVLKGTPPPIDGNSEIIAPRRYYLDKILVDAAVEAGAELRENCTVEEILIDNDTVTGVRWRAQDGNIFTEHARIVIGADGKNSILARTVRAEEYNVQPKSSCWYYTYWSGVPIDELTMYQVPYRAVGVIPTNDDLVCMPISWPASEFQKYRSDVEGNYMKTMKQVKGLMDLMSNAKREDRFTGMADLPAFFRQSYGRGWALVGDAAYHKDPITGQGMSDAMTRAEKLAEAIDAGFSEKEPLENALARYQNERDAEVMPIYQLTCEWATLQPPPPDMEYLLTALQGNQVEINRFVGTIAGTVPIPEFFSPENIQKIVSVAAD